MKSNRVNKIIFGALLTALPLTSIQATHVVVAVPYRGDEAPFDPHWYSPEYIDYIATLLPKEEYTTSGYFVTLPTIPQFISDINDLAKQREDLIILNFCDGGEWDGYPGVSLLVAWEKDPIHLKVPMTGGDAEFVRNSDDKIRMGEWVAKAGLHQLPSLLLTSQETEERESIERVLNTEWDAKWPLFCKLNIGAGATGVTTQSVCRSVEELKTQVARMHAQFPTSDLLIQPYLSGSEYTVLVIGESVIAAVERRFHNNDNIMLDEYISDAVPIEDEITYSPAPPHVSEVALKAIAAIPGRHHYTRIDLRDDKEGNTYVIDINDRPGFGESSTVNTMLRYNGKSGADLLLNIIKTAIDFHLEKQLRDRASSCQSCKTE